MKYLILFAFGMLLSSSAFCVELIQPKNATSEQIDTLTCIQQAKSKCINNACQLNSPISSLRNCQEICGQKAKKDCSQY